MVWQTVLGIKVVIEERGGAGVGPAAAVLA